MKTFHETFTVLNENYSPSNANGALQRITAICLKRHVARPCEASHSNYNLPNTDGFSGQVTSALASSSIVKKARPSNVHSKPRPSDSRKQYAYLFIASMRRT